MSAPVYAMLGSSDRDDMQETIDLNIVDESGRHVDIGASSAALSDGSVGTSKMADGAVTDAKIAPGSINADKLAPGVLPTAATPTLPGLVRQAAHVDPSTGTVQQVVESLVAAGIMAAS